MPTLYRQYRPAAFAQLVGQDHVTETLKGAIAKGRISHAYLFQGPRGTGKTSTARIFAKRLNCTQATDAEPCNACPNCQATSNNQNIDLIEIDAASNRSIEDIKALRESAYAVPARSQYKVYIIDEVHMLSHDAFGALLKILEEPPAHVVFILATTELHKVPATILSRCQLYRFRRATPNEMKQRLHYLLDQEKREADEAVIDFIISRADGCYRDAESLLGQLLTMQTDRLTSTEASQLLGVPAKEMIDAFLTALVRGQVAEAVRLVDAAHDSGLDIEQIIKEAIRSARDGAVAAAQQASPLPPFAEGSASVSRLPAIIRTLLQALQDLAYVPQPLIALHLAILSCALPGSAAATPAPLPVASTAVKPAIVPSVTPVVAAPSAFSVADVQAIWPALIQNMKEGSPVSSTFLRAMEPSAVSGTVITLNAQYQLHKNFFDKAGNKAALEKALSTLLKTSVQVRCQLPAPASEPPQSTVANNDVYNAVKEVFG